ncbi:hypothetical protein C464_09037 [Halorubrum coriense DSM 10284]|uniref:Uncharacterized protein n=1 Tax=Halorubrum coriense DSM 10284 TaxID=1227466 RepID=M0EJ42_9EURY|nr:hypothetical protein C464_09037 [Halorubrum coriense DSM 10284]
MSVLGSSIKEFTPERSWPTLRGYPPRIERGDTLDVPSPLTVSDTGVEVVVRPTYEDVYRLSTLSYYLGARMTTGDAPAIRLDNGYEERLPTEGRPLEERVTELLKTWFFLDTLARMEGYIPSDRHAYEAVGSSLPFYPPNLADRTMSERLMEYFEVDHETVSPHLPAWPTEAVLRPAPAAAELLPHLAHFLAPIRVRGNSILSAPHERLALATAVPTHGQPSAAHSDVDNVPDVTADPIPSWSSAISSVAYDNDLHRTPPDHGDLNVVFLIRSADRAQGVRNVLTSPSVPDGIGIFSVLEAPEAETVRDVWSGSSADLVYSDLPIEDGHLVAADGPVTLPSTGRPGRPSEQNGPAVSIFEGSRDVDIGFDALSRGGVAAAFLDRPFALDQIRTAITLLASVGAPLNTTLSVASGAEPPSVRFAGNASMSVVPPTTPVIELVFVESKSVSSHELTLGTPITPASWVGGEYNVSPDFLDKRARLIGYGISATHEVTSEEVAGVAEEPETVLFLNGELVPPGGDLTAEDVEISARSVDSNAEPPNFRHCE